MFPKSRTLTQQIFNFKTVSHLMLVVSLGMSVAGALDCLSAIPKLERHYFTLAASQTPRDLPLISLQIHQGRLQPRMPPREMVSPQPKGSPESITWTCTKLPNRLSQF